jgi:hypothetical protein
MKRGVIGSLNLHQWLNDIRNGSPHALRNVTIQLQNEDHTACDTEHPAPPQRGPVQQRWRSRCAGMVGNVKQPSRTSSPSTSSAGEPSACPPDFRL